MKRIQTTSMKVQRLHRAGRLLFALTLLLWAAIGLRPAQDMTLAQSSGGALAQSLDGLEGHLSTGYDLTWSTIASGGGYSSSSAEGYGLEGIVGQPNGGVATGGGYTLVGGFWTGGEGPVEYEYGIFLPTVLR